MTTDVTQTAHAVSSRALGWLHANRQYGALTDLPGPDLIDDADAYKAVGETALATSLVLRSGAAGSSQLALARELLEFCWDQLGEGRLLYERLLRHPLMTDPLETYAHFVRGGYRNAQLEQLAAHTMALRSTRAGELVPNRRLGVANSARVAGLTQDGEGNQGSDWTAMTEATWLGHTPEPWHIDWMTGYSVTHTAFHLSDWGRIPGALPTPIAGYLANWLPVWIDIWAETGQWDLMAELMIVENCLPTPHTDPDDWQRLADVQYEDGMVPRDDKAVEDDPAQRFDAHQHPTIVAVIAGTLALTRVLDEPHHSSS
ncbi:DUF6895 family protein [Streptomyces sp. CA-132043]|uniref:DUF6895 family protein n=1 Tax=Streptomyces sp. CA-132043 TaxID=3240048 RepID=UPI003D8D2520